MSHACFGSRHLRTRALVALAGVLIATTIALPSERAAAQGGSGRTVRLATIGELPSSQKRWALIIGIDEYTDEQLTPLRGAANDAKTLAAALTAYAGFPADQVVVLASDQPSSRRPTRGNILQRLSNLQSVVPKDGLLVVSFSGHGIERGGKAYLLPEDARAANDVGLLEDTAISVDRMRERIRATGVGQVMVLLDACRNDPVGGRADSTNALSAAYTRGFNFDVANREVQAFATLYATGVGDRAYEYAERRQGYFTWAVVDGLAGAAAEPDGRVTLAGLVRYVQTAVPKRIGVDLGAGKRQRPFATIEGYRADELVLAVAASPAAAPVATAPAPVVVDPKAVEVELWAAIKDSRDAADFEDYLTQYPSGSYASVARAKIKQLRAAATPVESAPVRPSPAGGGASAPVSRPAATGDTAVDLGGGVRIEMVLVPAGSFDMGGNAYDQKKPVQRVTISRPYLLGKYEVTQGQWKAVMGTNPSKFSGNDELPVEQVSWEDCQEFISRLNEKTGMQFRLPTEAEWEYACGGYTDTLNQVAWYGDNSGGTTHPVGEKQPNGWGLYDMHGNVMEWCQDWYGERIDGGSPATDPVGPSSGSGRVGRGGCWDDPGAIFRLMFRFNGRPSYRHVTLGLRLARTSSVAEPVRPAAVASGPTASLAPQGKVSSLELAPGVQMEFVQLPAGTFTMGISNWTGRRTPAEHYTPHTVSISRSFELGRYEVTQAEWEAVMGVNPSTHKGNDIPVTNVSWDDAQLFVAELNRREPTHTYRLPTEAEWEYACRAGFASLPGTALGLTGPYPEDSRGNHASLTCNC